MKLSQYNYNFSPELLAKYPADNRDESRLMVVERKTGKIEHRIFKEIIDYFNEKDVFIFNNTKVFPARLYGNKEKTGAEIEIFLLRELNRDLRLWDVLVDPARKIRIGNKLYFGDDDLLVAEVIGPHSTNSAKHPSPNGYATRWSRLTKSAIRRYSPPKRGR